MPHRSVGRLTLGRKRAFGLSPRQATNSSAAAPITTTMPHRAVISLGFGNENSARLHTTHTHTYSANSDYSQIERAKSELCVRVFVHSTLISVRVYHKTRKKCSVCVRLFCYRNRRPHENRHTHNAQSILSSNAFDAQPQPHCVSRRQNMCSTPHRRLN